MSNPTRRPATWLLALGIATTVAAGCAGPTPSETQAPSSTVQPAPTPTPTAAIEASDLPGLTYVVLGDSWPQGAHCGGCESFAVRYARGLHDLTGREIRFVDITGDRATTSVVLLENLRSDRVIRAAIATADIVVVATGPNDAESAWEAVAAGTCGGDGLACVRDLGELWATNFKAIVAEISVLREGRPTAIRLLSADDPFVTNPQFHEIFGLSRELGRSVGRLTFRLLTDAVCDAAAIVDAICLDVRPILNGPALNEPTDVETSENHQAVADAILAFGLPELGVETP